jgi:glutathione synthase/RimK-type ligase-like ATP-grasp enzyme
VILLCGIPSESPLAMVRRQLEELAVPCAVFNQRRFADTHLQFELAGGRVSGVLRMGGAAYRLEEFGAVYTRMMDDQALPELAAEPPGSALRARCRTLHETMACWQEIAPGRVVNRAGVQGSNSSKPYQAQLIRAHGLSIPATLVTNDPALVREFAARHGRVVYKSISGVRSIVRTLDAEALERLERIRWCPVQFQAFVPGTDVRVHTVGAGEVFATAVATDVTDYRYAGRQDAPVELTVAELPDDLAQRCLDLAAALGLPFAGIDLKLTDEGEAYCFEVNPSPAFSYYESHTGQPIARALARYLTGAA